VVTGANSGLGNVVSTRLAGLGARVYLLCRDRGRGERARVEIARGARNPDVHLAVVDVSSPDSIRDFVTRFEDREERLDVLVNNAGVFLPERRTSAEGLELTFATNTLGPFLLTNLLLPALMCSDSGRVINVTSAAMYFARLNTSDPLFEHRPYVGPMAYAHSKRATAELTRLWAQQLEGSGVGVHAMHPGWADTRSAADALPALAAPVRPLLRSPEQGADTLLWLAVNPNLTGADGGQFWFDRRPRETHRLGFGRSTEAERQRFWQLCCRLSGWTASSPSRH
jgi:NAD(P)-dependent dehydrogenase (short-subunit alcohol dehydrogenase family)